MEFTATLQQNAATVTSTLNAASFSVNDGWCDAQFKLTSTAAGGAGLITVALSGVPALLGDLSLADGQFFYNDVSAGRYEGTIRISSAGVMSFRVDNSTADLGTSPSFLVASTDELSCSFRFPVA